MVRSLMTRKRQVWRLPPLAAHIPASRILCISSSGTGSGFSRRMARVVWIMSNRSVVSAIAFSFQKKGRVMHAYRKLLPCITPPARVCIAHMQKGSPLGGSADTAAEETPCRGSAATVAKEQTMPDLTSLAASLGALLKAQGHTVA